MIVIDAAFGTGFPRRSGRFPDVGDAPYWRLTSAAGLDAATRRGVPDPIRRAADRHDCGREAGHYLGNGPDPVGGDLSSLPISASPVAPP